jgi:hypothetical protein
MAQIGPDYIAAFDPREYLAECYPAPNAEDQFGIRFMVAALRRMPPGLRALEFGGGPALPGVAVLAARASEIHFCDYVPANLTEVRRWLNDEPEAYNWRPYIKMVLEAEGGPATPETIARRAAEMRRKVTHLAACDALAELPLGAEAAPYDLVMARDCTDVAAANLAEWRRILQNVTTLVKPGGWLLVSVTTGATLSAVGTRLFPCVDLTPADIREGYAEAGYEMETFHLESSPVPAGLEYSGTISAVARRRINAQL